MLLRPPKKIKDKKNERNLDEIEKPWLLSMALKGKIESNFP